MRKLTLDETWKRCMPMWRWIRKRIRQDPSLVVHWLKEQWLSENDLGRDLEHDCYFCQYTEDHGGFAGQGNCLGCPGVLVDPDFDCLSVEYHYYGEPLAFLAKLESLYKRYKKQKKKKGRKAHA